MPTYAQLQASIISDLRNRSDLSALVTTEVPLQVLRYQGEPFTPQEATDTSITTVAGTSVYALPTTIRQVTGAWFLYGGNTWLPLHQISIELMNTLDNIEPPVQSPPTDYAIYGQQIRFDPTPSGAWDVKLNVINQVAAPSAPGDSNFWTNDAYALLRHATVAVIASQYLHDPELAQRAALLEQRELDMLRARGTLLSATGRIQPHWS